LSVLHLFRKATLCSRSACMATGTWSLSTAIGLLATPIRPQHGGVDQCCKPLSTSPRRSTRQMKGVQIDEYSTDPWKVYSGRNILRCKLSKTKYIFSKGQLCKFQGEKHRDCVGLRSPTVCQTEFIASTLQISLCRLEPIQNIYVLRTIASCLSG
jgi:hypothetical protein